MMAANVEQHPFMVQALNNEIERRPETRKLEPETARRSRAARLDLLG